MYHGHDYPEISPLSTPDLPQVSMTIEESVHYPLLGADSDDQWFSLTSESYGYVRLGPENRMFVISMFHELHCLRLLNLAFSKANVANKGHIKHCLNYIRQGVLCTPDLTLEPGDFEQRDFEVDRSGTTHTCRNWRSVYPVMDDNYALWLNTSRTR